VTLTTTAPYLLAAWALRTAAAVALILPVGTALSRPPPPSILTRPADAALAFERIVSALPGAAGWMLAVAGVYLLAARLMTLTWLSALARPHADARAHLRAGLSRLPPALLVGLLSLGPAGLGLCGAALLLLWLPRVGPDAQQWLGALSLAGAAAALLAVATWHDLSLARLVAGRPLSQALRPPASRRLARLCGRHAALLLGGAALWATGEVLGRAVTGAGLTLLVVPVHQGAAMLAMAVRGVWLALLVRE
jgi:hypothetical protein